jgi:hypothetical protein
VFHEQLQKFLYVKGGSNFMTIPKILSILIIAFFLLTACGETNQDVVNKYKPQLTQIRRDLTEVAQKIEATGGEKTAAGLSPQPKYVERGAEGLNTDILMYEQALDPDINLKENKRLDLLLSNSLVRALQWTGDKNAMKESALKNTATDLTTQTFEQSLQVKYVGLARIANYKPVTPVDDKTFGGGLADINGYLVDLKSKEVVCAFSLSSQVQKQVPYQYKKGDNQAQKLAEAATSTLWTNARTAFIAALNEKCGGEFKLAK